MRSINLRILSVIALVLSIVAFPFTSNADTLPTTGYLGGQTFQSVSSGQGTLTLNLPSGSTVKKIYILGNNDNGTANTSIVLTGVGINGTFGIDGVYHKINGSNVFVGGSNQILAYLLNGSGSYNLVFLYYK